MLRRPDNYGIDHWLYPIKCHITFKFEIIVVVVWLEDARNKKSWPAFELQQQERHLNSIQNGKSNNHSDHRPKHGRQDRH